MKQYLIAALLIVTFDIVYSSRSQEERPQLQQGDTQQEDPGVSCVATDDSTATCSSLSSPSSSIRKIGSLRPSDLPEPAVFTTFTSNTTMMLQQPPHNPLSSQEEELKNPIIAKIITVARGSVQQINRIIDDNNDSHHRYSSSPNKNNTTTETSTTMSVSSAATEFFVLPQVVSRQSVRNLLDLLNAYEYLDEDPDTVDGMPTYEIFVDSPELYKASIKFRDSDPVFVTDRRELRRKIQGILQPYLESIITPFVRQQYATSCNNTAAGSGGSSSSSRLCTPCYSLLRRYRHGDRVSHATHHDGHALVTVVVSLSDYDRDYRGGLYVSTGFGQSLEFLALNRGDAVVHQSTLLHGVRVHDKLHQPETTKRWSWILWYRDSIHCDDYSYEWFKDCATASSSSSPASPICQQLHATKVGNIPGISQAEAVRQILELNQKAAQGGAGMAAVKMARAYLHQLPSPVPYDEAKAAEYFEMAIQSHNPDGHYGMAQLLLTKISRRSAGQEEEDDAVNNNDNWMIEAIYHLEAAARQGHTFSQFNLGMVHTYGYGTGVIINGTLAASWFEASGLPEGYYIAAQQAQAVGDSQRYTRMMEQAQALGFMAPWRRQAREATGSGGAAGVSLNLPWPMAADGRTPPQL